MKPIIIDNNYMHKVIKRHKDCKTLWSSLFTNSKPRLCIYMGGRLKRELESQKCNLSVYVEWQRAGLLKRIPCAKVNKEEKALDQQKIKSDDPHVLALARVSDARVLCTNDIDLSHDFLNDRIINSPLGSVYSSDADCAVLN